MIQLGKEQELEVLRTTSIGVYLGEAADPLAVFTRNTVGNTSSITDKTDILLPTNEISSPLAVGDHVRVFVYLDSEDRPIATLRTPPLCIGSIAVLTVLDVTSIGAFLDWGLPKDLFLPFREQTGSIKPGDRVPVALYIDRSKRLCATMKLYKRLRADSDYSRDDRVTGTVYEISAEHGVYVAVDNIFSGMIPNRELVRTVHVGDSLSLRVAKVLPDGKLELSMREPSYLQLGTDCDVILKELQETEDGFLPYHDKSDGQEIRDRFGMTKNAFKRAIGHLMKEGRITIRDNGISLTQTGNSSKH